MNKNDNLNNSTFVSPVKKMVQQDEEHKKQQQQVIEDYFFKEDRPHFGNLNRILLF